MKIYIGNLSKKINDTQLRELAAPFGEPDSATIARALVGGASKGFAFVEYRMPAQGRAAIAGLHGKHVDGQALNVFDAKALRQHPWSVAGRR